MDAAWSPGDGGSVVGVVDHETAASETLTGAVDALETRLADRDATIVSDSLEDVLAAEPSLLLAAGEPALSDVARNGTRTPVLPVGDVGGVESVSIDRLPEALEAALEGEARTQTHPVLGVELEGATSRALFDATLVTDEPARISEYSVRSGGDLVDSFRADGVVVATPAGTGGYASAVNAPSLSASVDAVAVAPIGPFTTRTQRWVLPDDAVELAVERDEGAVTLVVDGRSVGTAPVGSPVSIGADGTLETLVVPTASLEEREQ
ncbi:ATP-NAD kinase [Natronococcus pandeyae]|uniref:ATP-NAD kinase n=1 Tax=Natronococcus pandeyae TaxID=2055836 RepID=A0A8J8Q700_9EURY|nr:NAD(+)/NADH kinase [Natronococcus pandeyae]TYL40606.1 ATP-NAD kinase [Natronococcus pandeyae]